jgi:hypothetical protein
MVAPQEINIFLAVFTYILVGGFLSSRNFRFGV